MNGYIKAYRSINDHELLDEDNSCFIVFMKILLRADRKTGTYTTGRFKLAEITNLKPTTAYSALRRLQNDNMLTLQSDNKKTVITICNWSKFQSTDDNKNDNEMTTDRQQNDNKMTLNKNKEIEKREIEKEKVSNDTLAPKGKPDINEAFKSWQELTGLAITSQVQANRFAASNLLKKHGADGVRKLIKLVAASQQDRYAPQVADFRGLQAKQNELLVWAKKTMATQQNNQIISV